MPKRYKDLYSILKLKLKIGEKLVQTIRIMKILIFIVAMILIFISDHATGDDNDDMDDTSSDSQGSNRSSFDYRSDESDDEQCSFESKLKLVDFDIHDEIKDKFLKFTDSYDAWITFTNIILSEFQPN
jgi:hypothetical protein